jgi:hypothetical protein
MNREEIIRMAQEAISLKMEDHVWTMSTTHLERFAALVAEHERNACAKVVEAIDRNGAWVTKEEAAAAIRARGKLCG